MAAPTVFSYSDSSIILIWSSLSASVNGDSDITKYELYWDDGTTTTNIQLTSALVNTYTINGGLTGGTDYLFKVRAYNIYGAGSFSTTTSITAIDVPN